MYTQIRDFIEIVKLFVFNTNVFIRIFQASAIPVNLAYID
ncbi:15921_t:CDS:2 [Funneliformis geosporum]|nr:15921_t:CDS:2 [Funneliformis geosporum]